MNVWIIDHYSSEPQYGGFYRQYDFALGLSKKGYNVLVIASSFSHFNHCYFTEGILTINEINPKVHFAYLKTIAYQNNTGIRRSIGSSFSFVYQVIRNSKKLQNQFGKPDVVVGCSMHPFTWIAAQTVAKRYKAKFIVEVRDFWPQCLVDTNAMSPQNPVAKILAYLEKWAFNKADKIIYSLSEGDKYICDKLGYPREKVVWIGHPLFRENYDKNAKRYDEVPKEIRTFIGDSFLCVFTGYYMEYEGVMVMLEAANILRDKPIKFLFLGSGDARNSMIEFKEKNSLGNVYIGNRISKELIPSILRKSDICLVHLAEKTSKKTYQYGISKNKMNEYLYADSVIIFGSYYPYSVINDNNIGYCIEPYNAQEFASKILEVYEMTDRERSKFGENARIYVNNNISIEKLTAKYIKLLESLF